ncbi:hypothetical protein NP233_g1963 [Leucocoprinus birnbaumii]|uniref:Uncharacterized protein n=1 Tax=Leucocoprinus birnbaumii TaxID=56174 RepID=A0AAD5W263_9AGAR|nr:hypothetical protein NP233_g1963 [Leucocoprinus birnbaumii]
MLPTDSFQPVQLKGEIMDLEFTIDTDHSVIASGHASATGLCVYEIDDPALRDDPSVDENTRLRNRIAELESLVRELRGKPHPRWADSNFRDGDPNEKWHSRATKCAPSKRSPDSSSRANRTAAGSNLVYTVSLLPLVLALAQRGIINHSQENSERTMEAQAHPTIDQRNYSPNQAYGGHPAAYHAHSGSGASSYSTDGSGSYGSNHAYGTTAANDQYGSPHQQVYCPCRTSPATGVAYLTLSQQLQNSLTPLRQYTHHGQCQLFRKILELNDMMHSGIEMTESTTSAHGAAAGQQTQPYDSNTPSDNELLTPLSASSGHASFHTGTGSPGVASQEWNNLATAGYNPYFPLPANGDHHNVYSHVMP